MTFEIVVEDNFTSIHLSDEVTLEDIGSLWDHLKNDFLDTPYFILMGMDSLLVSEEIINQLIDLNTEISEKAGSIVFVGFSEEMNDALEANELVVIPTFDEAVDYLFMVQLERDLENED